MAAVSRQELSDIKKFVQNGGTVIATSDFSLVDENGNEYESAEHEELMGISYTGDRRSFVWNGGKLIQTYGFPKENDQLDIKLDGTSLFALDGELTGFKCCGAFPIAECGAGFRVYPEGLSYPDPSFSGDRYPLICSFRYGNGTFIYLGWPAGSEFHNTGISDIGRIIEELIHGSIPSDSWIDVEAPESVWVFQRRQGKRTNIHLINTTGSSRFLREVVPVHDIQVRVPLNLRNHNARLVKENSEIKIGDDGILHIPELTDYEIISLE